MFRKSLREQIRELVKQGDQESNIKHFFKMFMKEMRNEYTEDNSVTLEDFVLECLCSQFKAIKYDSKTISLKNESTIKTADDFKRQLNKNVEDNVQKLLEAVYRKIHYFTNVKHENYFIFCGNNVCKHDYHSIDGARPKYTFSQNIWEEMFSSYEKDRVIEELKNRMFVFDEVPIGKNIYGELYYRNRISW